MKQEILLIVILVSTILGTSIMPQTVFAQTFIPDWIKTVAQYWVNEQTTDDEFIAAIQFLIERGTISVSANEPMLDVDELTLGFIPNEKADGLTPKADALKKFLEKQMPGVTIKIVVPTNYETIIEGIRFGHIDAAFMDTGPAWITHTRTGAQVILAEVVQGKTNYQATVWTLQENKSIQTINDTLGKRVAFTSITGSSGFIRPVGTLVTSGQIEIQGNDIIALEKALQNSFKSHTFAGGYKTALELLLNENVDVAFGSDIAPQKYLNVEDQAKLRQVTTVGPVPSHVFVVNPDMSDFTRELLVDALVKLNYEENNKILTDIYGADALLPTTTKMHIGNFGDFINALTGLDQLILDKYNKNK